MTTKPKYLMIPYQQEDRDIYDGLEFDPEDLAEALWPGNMYQDPALFEAMYLLRDHFVGSPGRRDVLVTGVGFICYDRSNLNVRIGPDCMVAIGVDARAIRRRLLYLPWEVGKMPDFILEAASSSTAAYDVRTKRHIYESIGVGEYWYFDSSGGDLYGDPLAGRQRADDGSYQRLPVTQEDDGSIRGYSPALDLYLAWERNEEGEAIIRIYDPATGQRMQPYSEVKARAASAEERAASAESEVERLQAELRRLRGE